MQSCDPGRGPVVDACAHSNRPSSPIRSGDLLDQLSNCQLSQRNNAQWSLLTMLGVTSSKGREAAQVLIRAISSQGSVKTKSCRGVCEGRKATACCTSVVGNVCISEIAFLPLIISFWSINCKGRLTQSVATYEFHSVTTVLAPEHSSDFVFLIVEICNRLLKTSEHYARPPFPDQSMNERCDPRRIRAAQSRDRHRMHKNCTLFKDSPCLM